MIDGIDLIIANGQLLTLDDGDQLAEAVAISRDRIVAVGKNEDIMELKNSETQVIDLEGKTMIPGFNDAHTHVDLYGMMTSDYVVSCHLPPLKSKEDILQNIKDEVMDRPGGELILGQGRAVQPYPTREELDQVAPDNPVVIKASMHSYYLNSCALKKFGITATEPSFEELYNKVPGAFIERDQSSGEPSGYVEEAWNYLYPGSKSPLNYKQTYDSLKKGLDALTEHGITSVSEFACYAESTNIYQKMYKNNELKVRMQLIPCFHGLKKTVQLDEIIRSGLTSGLGDHWIKFGGLKMFIDLQQHTICNTVELDHWFSKAHRAGIRMFMHAITDQGQQMALSAIENEAERGSLESVRAMRHRIEHLGNENHNPDYFNRVKETGAIGVPTAYFMNIGPYDLMSAETSGKYMFRTMLDLGLCVPGNSDGGGSIPESVNPFYQIWCMVKRQAHDGEPVTPSERISTLEALKLYTKHSAYAGCEEQEKGSIAAGKLADFAVLSHNPLEIPDDSLLEIEVEMTILGGEVVYSQ